MPDQPEEKRSVILKVAPRGDAAQPGGDSRASSRLARHPDLLPYAELHCKTNFSFLEGASHPDELVERAAELGYSALAITDLNSLAGVVRAHGAAKQVGLKLLIGAEIVPIDAPPVVLLATDRKAYGRLSRLITRGRRNAEKGECRLTFDDIAEHSAGLLACVTDEPARYREIFDDDRCSLLVELHHVDDERTLETAIRESKRSGVPLAAAGGVRFHVPERRPLADVLTAIRVTRPVADCGELLFPNAERYLKSREPIATLFPPQAIRRTLEVADRCTFNLDELRYEYPEELAPRGQTPLEHLTRLTWEGAQGRYPDGIPDKVRSLIEHELVLIADLKYEAYFLTIWDLVRYARSRNILCQGRGSAANSVVCFCLGVTSVDPERIDVLFERFISKERAEAPDIDVDFEHARREEVIQYVYDKYGRERAGMTAEVITYRPRSAVRDVGKALGLSLERVDALAKTLDSYKVQALEDRCRMAGLDPNAPVVRQMQDFVQELVGFPRHLGQHVGGLVITNGPLCELVPIENASMPDRTVIEWDKDDLDELGILKVDCLALGMLTAIHKCFDLVLDHRGRDLNLANIPEGDEPTYEMIRRADTMGVFQIESRAQMSMLPRLKPACFYDLVIEVAIVRPGPIQGDMVHPYLRRRENKEPVEYPNEEIRQVLHKTLGVPLFQEQAMRLAVVAAGFTPGEADQLRRAMAAWRRPGVIEAFRTKLLDGMRAKGLDPQFAENVFKQIKGFGEYGFPESHAASFALLAYVSAWLKCHYPAEFCVALINSQPMGFYAPAQLIRDAREHGIEVLPVDVNHSRWDCTLEPPSGACLDRENSACTKTASDDATYDHAPPKYPYAIRLGLRMLGGLGEAAARTIEREQDTANNSPLHSTIVSPQPAFHSVEDFTKRTKLSPAIVSRLARADAFGSMELNRRQSLWQSLGQRKESRPLFDNLPDDEPLTPLSPMSGQEEVLADYRTSGLSLKAHPLSFYRADLAAMRVVPAASLASMKDGRYVRVAGLVLVRQRPSTAKGITFVTIEDETGVANLIIRMDVWERFYKVARTATAYIAYGRLQNQQGIIHVLVSKLENMSVALESQSRDFH